MSLLKGCRGRRMRLRSWRLRIMWVGRGSGMLCPRGKWKISPLSLQWIMRCLIGRLITFTLGISSARYIRTSSPTLNHLTLLKTTHSHLSISFLYLDWNLMESMSHHKSSKRITTSISLKSKNLSLKKYNSMRKLNTRFLKSVKILKILLSWPMQGKIYRLSL